MKSVLVLLLLAVLPFALSYSCTVEEDCALNGQCINSACVCNPGWKGDDCGALDFLPGTKNTGYNRTDESISTWGGKIIQDPSNSSLYHLFAAQMAYKCNLNYWSPYSTIIRATSDNPIGPYTWQEEVVSSFAHNPTVIWSEAHQLWVMAHIGCDQNMTLPENCTNIVISCDPGSITCGESGITMRAAKSLEGPWQNFGMVLPGNPDLSAWDRDTTNPSPFPLNNGSIVLVYRGCPQNNDNAPWGELISVAYADQLEGPYTRLFDHPVFSAPAEDPFVWVDPNGNWHMLMHALSGGGFIHVGGHAFARSFEGPWTFWNRTLAYDTTISFEDGTNITYIRRERPQLLLDEKGNPIFLVNGVQETWTPVTYTFIQGIRS